MSTTRFPSRKYPYRERYSAVDENLFEFGANEKQKERDKNSIVRVVGVYEKHNDLHDRDIWNFIKRFLELKYITKNVAGYGYVLDLIDELLNEGRLYDQEGIFSLPHPV
jgi:hypothetical protein